MRAPASNAGPPVLGLHREVMEAADRQVGGPVTGPPEAVTADATRAQARCLVAGVLATVPGPAGAGQAQWPDRAAVAWSA